jgi:hypothetical protein
MIELRDEERPMVSLGGWLRGFEIGTIVTPRITARSAPPPHEDRCEGLLSTALTLNPR